MDMIDSVRAIMAAPDWSSVAISDHGEFVTIRGIFLGTAHAGSRKDYVELARDLDRIARYREEPTPTPEPEPEETCAPPPVEPDPVLFDDPPPSEIDALEDLIAEKDAELSERDARIAELEAQLEAERDAHRFPASLDEKLGDYADLEAEKALTTDDLFALMNKGVDDAQDVIGKLSGGARKRFTELLNVELAELQQAHGGKGENRKREADIEKMLGLFARAGEV